MLKRKKVLPKSDKWFTIGSRSAHNDGINSLEDAIAAENPPTEELGVFTRGYLRGRVAEADNDFNYWLKFMDNDQLMRLGTALRQLRDQFNEELSRPDATYKVKGLFDQFND